MGEKKPYGLNAYVYNLKKPTNIYRRKLTANKFRNAFHKSALIISCFSLVLE